jgi:PAS domain S-box-containing protein
MQPSDPAIIVRSTAGVIIGWNDAAAQLLGFDAGEALGRPFTQIMPVDEKPDVPVAERVCVRRDGLPVRTMSRRVLLTDGSDRTVAISDALTALEQLPSPARSQAEPSKDALVERLRTERERLESVIASSPGVVLSYRLGRDRAELSFLSSAAEELYGFTPAQIKADPALIIDRIPKPDGQRLWSAQRASARNAQPWHAVFRYLHPSGELKWLEGRTRPTRAVDGSLEWHGVIIDVTSRRQAEEELQILQAQLETALAATGMGAFILDLDTHMAWGNHTTRALWEIPESVAGWYQISEARARIHPDDEARVVAERDRAIVSGGLMETEFRILRSDGERWLSLRARVQLESERPRRMAGVELDITQQKLAEEASLRTRKLEALGTLAGGVAHDFNNVLFAITGNASLTLAGLPESSPVRGYVEQIASAADRATELVRKILAFSRPQQHERSTLSLSEVVRGALALVRASTPAMVEIVSELEPSAHIVADRSRVEQIVVNLCSNAVQAIGRGRAGRVLVAVKSRVKAEPAAGIPSEGDYVLLSVTDDGCGMDQTTRARIFDPFFTTRSPGEGAGLGLAVVHSFVRALDGHVTVRSEPGRGSTFRVFFPVAPGVEAPRSNPPSEGGQGQSILFVDDEPMLVQLGESMLDVLGYRADVYQEPAAALEAFQRKPRTYAAAITDLSMPGMSGFDLSRALLAIRPDLPILVMSGYLGSEERTTAERLGIRELVLKPVTMAKLRELLASLCSGTQARR